MLSLSIGILAVALYAGATFALLRSLRDEPATGGPALWLSLAAVILHAVVLHDAVLEPGALHLGFFHALALAAWVIVTLMLLLTLREPVATLGLGLFPIAALALLAMLVTGRPDTAATIPTASGGLAVHVLVSICAYAVLSLAAMQALLLGLQHRLLHDHHPRQAVRALPPLYVMEALLFRMIAIGFVLLTVALASGFIYLEDMFAQHLVHKTVLSILAWGVFATLLCGHYLVGWRGLTAVRFTLGGIASLVLAYFGSKLVLELILGRA